ncbi:hypothetical protein BFJ63_vAg18877 [Fusarium oxysporum f. sp. narcissi]|uniref:2-dehydropantoate 2-reductase n=1 Tax=Fusarium oxysporum f. sp. narcissi TaxID=451672 RepID=A0A4Q2V0I2_FUSOX|nr:hypothetical protein BFJ63_vAg18877 [Fusarium oxysporum f. sp. narcissi]
MSATHDSTPDEIYESDHKMKTALVFGTGSIGIMYTMILERAGVEVTCVCRSNYSAARKSGFRVESTIFGHKTFRTKVVQSVSEAVQDDQRFDFVIMATKSLPSTSGALVSAISPALKHKETALIIMSNGIGVEDVYHSAFPQNTILSAVTYMPTVQVAPGVVLHQEIERLHVGTYPSCTETLFQRETLDVFAEAIKRGGGTCIVHEDVQAERWKKLVANAVWNPICALTRCTDMQFLEANVASRRFVSETMAEVVNVAAAVGYGDHVTLDTVDMQMNRVKFRTWPGVRPSMLVDMEVGRRMEVQAIIGEVVELGYKYKLSTPNLTALNVLIAGLDWALSNNKSAD